MDDNQEKNTQDMLDTKPLEKSSSDAGEKDSSKDKQQTKTESGQSDKQKQDKDKKKAESKGISNIINDFRGEFRKIIWPSRKELVKQTITVIAISLMFGFIIFCLDFVYSTGVQLFVRYVAK